MSKDPLVPSALTAGAAHDVDYDAVYAAVTATERGRWFLTEYASRNRHADTHVIVAAIGRVEAAVRTEASSPGDAAPELAGIAAVIEEIRTAIADQAAPAVDIGTAVERIRDVASALRERAIDVPLCDALDGAVRRLAALGAARTQPARPVAVLLRELADRVDALLRQPRGQGRSAPPADAAAAGPDGTPLADQIASPDSGPLPPPAGESDDNRAAEISGDDDELSRPALFAMDFEQSSKLTDAVATLTASLTDAASAIDPRGELPPMSLGPQAAEVVPVPVEPPRIDKPRWHIDAPEFVFSPTVRVLRQDAAALTEATYQGSPFLPEAQLQSSPVAETRRAAETTDIAAVAKEETPAMPMEPVVSDLPSAEPARPAPPPVRANNGPPARSVQRTASAEAAAAFRGLSEEELNALFA